MAGTGLYATKAVPTKVDDTQSGAPVGQVITLVTGGLGTADAFKGGYVTNVTRTETRAIVSHTDNTVTLEGTLGSWVDTDDLDIYDSWSTIQAALDQLWADQGSTIFAAVQEIRIYDGTYTETATPNTGFVPCPTFDLRIWGATGNSPVIDGESTRANGITATNVEFLHVKNVIVRDVTGTGISIAGVNGGNTATVAYCTITNAGVWGITAGQVRDCEVDGESSGARGIYGWLVERCHIHHITAIACGARWTYSAYGAPPRYEGCLIHDVGGSVIDIGNVGAHDRTYGVEFRNCTFYNIPKLAYGYWGNARFRLHFLMQGCIIHTITTLMFDNTWGVRGEIDLTSDYNWFYNITDWMNEPNADSFAEWQALGHDASSFEADPLLTDPGAGDFSLQAESPCLNTGRGVGVATDYRGIAFDPHHPDIGAWSSGEAAGHLTPVLDSVTNVGDAETVTLAVSNVEGSRSVHAFYRRFGSTLPFTESPTIRTGPGNLTLGSLEDGTTYEVFVITSDGTSSDMPSLPSNLIVFMPSIVTVGEETALEGQGNLGLQLASDCRDIAVVNLDLALVDGTVQVKQALCIALRMFRGEWFLDANAGVPYYQSVLVKSPKLSAVNSIVKAEILKVEHVLKILEFTSEFDRALRKLSVKFRVDTTFGPVTVEETL